MLFVHLSYEARMSMLDSLFTHILVFVYRKRTIKGKLRLSLPTFLSSAKSKK